MQKSISKLTFFCVKVRAENENMTILIQYQTNDVLGIQKSIVYQAGDKKLVYNEMMGFQRCRLKESNDEESLAQNILERNSEELMEVLFFSSFYLHSFYSLNGSF